MYSPPWLGEHDELFKFISPPNCEQQQERTLQQRQQNMKSTGDPSHLFGTDHKVPFNLPAKTISHGRKSSTSGTLDNVVAARVRVPKDSLIKKILHRDVERQRRLEMSLLCQNLHSLIPSAYLQKRRSMTDHLEGTIKYIMHMKNEVEELKSKREKLIQNEAIVEEPCLNVSVEQPIIKVKNCKEGMEITVNIGINHKKDLPLSKILKILASEGMSIKTCTSARVHERLLHVIESEVKEDRFIDPDELRRKLMRNE